MIPISLKPDCVNDGYFKLWKLEFVPSNQLLTGIWNPFESFIHASLLSEWSNLCVKVCTSVFDRKISLHWIKPEVF